MRKNKIFAQNYLTSIQAVYFLESNQSVLVTKAKKGSKVQEFARKKVLTLTKICQNGVFKIISQKK